MKKAVVQKLQSILHNATCLEMDNRGSFLQILLGSHSLIIGAAWRFVKDGDIVMGSGSADEVLEQLPELLIGRTVQSVSVNGPFHDLHLEFEDGSTLEVFADSELYEHWNLGLSVIAGPGNLWSSFLKP